MVFRNSIAYRAGHWSDTDDDGWPHNLYVITYEGRR